MAISFSATNGDATLTVHDPSHGSSTGDFVEFESVSGLTSQLNTDIGNSGVPHVITSVTTDTYTLELANPADGDYSEQGQASAFYLLSTGLATTILGPGWGAGTWGRFTWGSGVPSLAGETLRIWFADNFGEDLIFVNADGQIFYWDASSGVNTRAIPIQSLSGSNETPVVARKILVSEADRHVIAFGTNALGSTIQDPLLIRFSDQENPADWNPTATNTAGDLRLSQGSEIITAVRTSRQILV